MFPTPDPSLPSARRPLLLASAAALASLLLLAGCQDEQAKANVPPPAPPPVSVSKPIVKKIVEDDEFVGRFSAVSEVEIRSRVSGYLRSVDFTDGQIVKEGDLLFTIDPRPFETALRQAQAEVDSAKAAVAFTKTDVERAEELIGRDNISRQRLDERRQAYLAAAARLASAQAQLERAELDLEYTRIRAPITGRIDRKYLSEGNLVEENSTVLTNLVSTDPMYFYFDIDERSYLAYARDARARGAQLQEGGGNLPVKVRLSDDKGNGFGGHLDFSENRLDPATGSMRVRAIIPNPDHVLQPGLFGRINVPGSLPYDGILLPDEAIASDQNRRVVYVVDAKGQVAAKQVQPGPRIDGYRVIRKGLTGDETVVVNGLMRVRPGAAVTPNAVELPLVAE